MLSCSFGFIPKCWFVFVFKWKKKQIRWIIWTSLFTSLLVTQKTNSKAIHLSIRCSPANRRLTKNIRKKGATFAKWNKFSDNMKVSRKKIKQKFLYGLSVVIVFVVPLISAVQWYHRCLTSLLFFWVRVLSLFGLFM